MRLTTGQFATYYSVLNQGKANLHNIKYKNRTTKSPKVSWKFTGYLLFALLLVGDVHANPGPTVRDMDRDQYHSTANAANSPSCLDGNASYVGYTGPGDDHYATEVNGLGVFSANPSAAIVNPSCCYVLPNVQMTSAGPSKRVNPAIVKNRGFRLFQTVRQARILWNRNVKPRGLLDGHLNMPCPKVNSCSISCMNPKLTFYA